VVIHIDLQGPQAQPQDTSGQTTSPDGASTPDTSTKTATPDPASAPDDTQNQAPDPGSAPDGAQGPAPDDRDFQDKYQLLSDAGLYDRTLSRSEATKEGEDLLVLRFTEVVPEGTYSLYHRLPSGVVFPVFIEVPFTVLEDHGSETEEPTAETWELPTFEPEPEMVSGDEHLLHHPADHAEIEGPDEWWTVPLWGTQSAPSSETGPEAENDAGAGSDGDSAPDSNSGAPAESGSAGDQDAPPGSGDDPQ